MGKWKIRGSWASLLLAAFLAWAIGHVLDLTATGTLRLWSQILHIATFGSQRMRDTPFESAALNPYPVPSLALILAGCGVCVGVTLMLSQQIFIAYLKTRELSHSLSKPPSTEVKQAESFESRIQKVKRNLLKGAALVAALYIFDVCLIVPVSLINEAIAAPRIYEANRDMVMPFLTPSQSTQLQADFASIETKAQYLVVMNRIADVAAVHHLKLHQFTW